MLAPSREKPIVLNIQSAINLFFSFGTIISIAAFARQFYELNWPASQFEFFRVVPPSTPINRIILYAGLAGWSAGALFLVRKLRTNPALSIVVLILVNARFIISRLVNSYREYVPAAWEFDADSEWMKVLQILIFGILSFLLYLGLARTKRLPYPS
jgi:hypothetical protein